MQLRKFDKDKHVRRMIVVLLLLLLVFTLAACGGGDENTDDDGGDDAPATQVEDSDAQSDDAAEDPTATPTDEPEADPTATDTPEVEPTATDEPETDMTDEPATDTDTAAPAGDIEIPEDAPKLIVGTSSPLDVRDSAGMFGKVIDQVTDITLYAVGINGDYLLVTEGTWLGWVNRFGGNRFKLEGDLNTLPESDYKVE